MRNAVIKITDLTHFHINTFDSHKQDKVTCYFFFFLFYFILFIYLFIYGCVGSSFLCEGFLQLWQVGAPLHCGAQASHYRGLSCCGAQAPDAQGQQLWLTGLVAPRHVGSSQTRARTRVPCIGRQILNHCATREALLFLKLTSAYIAESYTLLFTYRHRVFFKMYFLKILH